MKAKLKLKKLVVSGKEYKRTLDIGYQFVRIRGDGFSGKSLVLNLIDYCLGAKSDIIDLEVQKELVKYCDEVFLELEINDKIYTLNRGIKENRNIVNIYLCAYNEYSEYSPWKKQLDEANEFIANELQIPLHFILRKKAGSKDLSKQNLTFRDFMRFISIHQGDLGTNQFMKNNNTFVSGKNKEIFKVINNLIIPDLEDIENQLQLKQNEYNRLEKINSGLNDYLIKRDAIVLLELSKKKDEINKKVRNLVNKKENIINNSKNEKSEIYINLKVDIKNLDEMLIDKNSELNNLDLPIKNKKELLKDYKEEQSQLYATLEAMKKIKKIEHSEKCPLCNNLIKVNEVTESYEDIEDVLKNIKNKIEMLMSMIDIDEDKCNIIMQDYNKLNDKKQIYINALEKYQENIKIPYLSEIESINSMIRDYNIDKNKINSLIDIHNEIKENRVNLEVLTEEISKLKKNKNELQKKEKSEKNILENLNKIYRNSMKRFNFIDIEEEKCYISSENYLPYYNGISVLKHTSGCLLLCMQIAYLGAILEVNAIEKENCHPGILFLDTVSNNIGTNTDDDSIDPKTYNELYEYLVELSEKNQIFIIDNTPPKTSKMPKEFVFKRVANGEVLRGFIDLTKNEK